MRIIDAHVHLYPPEAGREPTAWAEKSGEGHWSTLCTRRRKNGRAVQSFPSVDGLLRDMDAAGVAVAVLQGWYWERPATCTWQNDFYARCLEAHPDRLRAFAAVHAGAGNAALEEVKRRRDEGFCGLGELSPHTQGIGLHDPDWVRLMALAGELKLPVNLHVTDPQSRPYPGRVETPLADFVRLAREFPATKFILAHWGGGLAFDSECRPLRNVYYDSSASPLMYGTDVWLRAARATASERIVFGSDYPLVLYPNTELDPSFTGILAEVASAGLNEAQKVALLSGTITNLVGKEG